MKYRLWYLLIIFGSFLVACSSPVTQLTSFEDGLSEVRTLHTEYNTTFDTYPQNENDIIQLHTKLASLQSVEFQNEQDMAPFQSLLAGRLHDLNASMLYAQSKKYGPYGTTRDGFGCKSLPVIINSSDLRLQAAHEGEIAAVIFKEFIEKYPEYATLANITLKNTLFLNATYYIVKKEALRDRNIVNNFCLKNGSG